MRYVTLLLYPDPDALHPVEARLAEDPAISREAMHAFKELPDGSIVLLAEVSGDLDRYREIMDESPAVYEFAISGEEMGYCYSHVEPSPLVSEFIEQKQAAEFVVQLPIEYTEEGAQRITLVGREDDFVGAPLDTPETFEMELVSTGPYRPSSEDVFAELTDRQREVLETALRLGYYENPRQATHEDIASETGVEPGTVGKHLRNVESRVFSKYVV